MSCCAPKEGLAALAENPGIILVAYLCALLPLAAIYALDFINKDWKSIRDTRHAGKFHLAFSIPPLAAVVFYVHLQKEAGDYKEMATAITAAILCILHILRTLWGLLQLHAFKKWNMHALRILVRLGFNAPTYATQAERESWSNPPSDSNRDVEPTQSLISKIFTRFVGIIRRTLGLEKLKKVKLELVRFSREPTAIDIGRTVDRHMVVNNSLVDNEFFGAELPCQFNFSLLSNAFSKKGLSVTDLFTPKEPEECAVRWACAFLAGCGSEWLVRSRQDIKEEFSNRLLAFIACTVTHSVAIQSEGRDGTSSQEVSNLSPFHVLCSDLVMPWECSLKVPEENHLPYQMRGRNKSADLYFDEYRTNIRKCISAWDKNSLDNILNEEEKSAVLNISSHQVAWFSKLVEEKNFHVLPLGNFRCYSSISDKSSARCTLIWQFGHASETFNVDTIALPVLEKSLHRRVDGHAVLQASVHADNWLALEADNFPGSCGQAQTECRDLKQMFGVQKRIELQRLKFELPSKCEDTDWGVAKIKFLGCVMESVRSSLAFWLDENDNASERLDRDPVDWKPPIVRNSCDVICSDQLNEAFEEAASQYITKTDSEPDPFQRRSLLMRVLWEIQQNLMRLGSGAPSSPSLMMLCMLGYPSLRISKVDACAPVLPVAQSGNSEHVAVTLHENSTRNCSRENYLCYRIDIVKAPQQLHILFQWNSVSKKASVQIGCTERRVVSRFCWQSWKNGFMGRICAQSEWRSTRLRHTKEKIRTEAVSSEVTDGIETNDDFSSLDEDIVEDIWVTYWKGWPPFLSEITVFEKDVSGRDSNLDELLDLVPWEAQKDASHDNETEGEQKENDSNSHDNETEGEHMEYDSNSNDNDIEGAVSVLNSNPDELLNLVHCKEQKDISHDNETEGEQKEDDSNSHGNDIEGERQELASKSQDNETEGDASSEEIECKCGCEIHGIFQNAGQHLIRGNENGALDMLRHCFRNYKHFLALQEYISVLARKSSVYTKRIASLPRDINWAMGEQIFTTRCRKFKRFDMEEVIELLGKLYEKSGSAEVLYQKARMLLLRSRNRKSVDESCIEAFESYLLLENRSGYYAKLTCFDLALCYFQKHALSGYQFDEDIAVQHCRRLTTVSPLTDMLSPADIAFLIGKGSVSMREFERIGVSATDSRDWFERGLNMMSTLKRIFLWSSNVGYRISRNAKAACAIYSDFISYRERDFFGKESVRQAANRLALIYHKGLDGINQNRGEAEKMYKKAICQQRDVQSINSMSNLAVLHGPRENDLANPNSAIERIRAAKEQFETLERNEDHSTSLNNLAVIMEAEGNLEGAKMLYHRSRGIDENPVSMYNLAVLLKFKYQSPENLDNLVEAEDLFSDLACLGADLQSTPVLAANLEKARRITVSEISTEFLFALEEVDDCLGYVKIVDSRPSPPCS